MFREVKGSGKLFTKEQSSAFKFMLLDTLVHRHKDDEEEQSKPAGIPVENYT